MKWATTILVAAVAGLMALGMVMLYSASMAQSGSRYLIMQLAWGGLGLIACMAATIIDYRRLQSFAWPLLGLTLLLLVLVLIPGIGVERNGARRWFNLGPMHFQPSELAKVGLLVALAAYGAKFHDKMREFKRGLLIPGIVLAVLLGLIFKEPDFGTTLLLATVSIIVLLVAGADWRYLVPPALAGVALFALAVFNDPVRMRRIMAFLHPDEHKADAGFQAYHAMLALGSGGATGLGLGNGRQKLGFVPEHHTDFIFSIIGEELGAIATLAVVVAFMVIVLCGLYISWRSGNRFGQLLGCGLTFLIGLQAFINIGVVTSALPNKGLPLPFISYGGSSLFAMLTVVGLLLSIASHAAESEPTPAATSNEQGTAPLEGNPFAEAP
ncbi:MAG: putative lipid II flippase FtsW [Pedosphaera sp.]|nr:putative lipid II flippase FtsW [Pedosphaera sp.]MSU43178.1 putative lipid II flippase FtsW [Pedosphaera sp.]